jgi:hypothetical protein
MSTGFTLFLVVSLIGLAGFIASIVQRKSGGLPKNQNDVSNEYFDWEKDWGKYWKERSDDDYKRRCEEHTSPSYSYLPHNIHHNDD